MDQEAQCTMRIIYYWTEIYFHKCIPIVSGYLYLAFLGGCGKAYLIDEGVLYVIIFSEKYSME